jgi:hypothetical protein
VAADRPPGRAGCPDAHAESEADKRRRKDADPGFAIVAGVNRTEKRGRNPGRLPEAGARRLEELKQQAGDQPEPGDDVDAPDAVTLT